MRTMSCQGYDRKNRLNLKEMKARSRKVIALCSVEEIGSFSPKCRFHSFSSERASLQEFPPSAFRHRELQEEHSKGQHSRKPTNPLGGSQNRTSGRILTPTHRLRVAIRVSIAYFDASRCLPPDS